MCMDVHARTLCCRLLKLPLCRCACLPVMFSVDVLTAMGQRMFKVAYESVTPAQRATAKSCVYATLYGAGPGKVAEDVSGGASSSIRTARASRCVEPPSCAAPCRLAQLSVSRAVSCCRVSVGVRSLASDRTI